jgi:hypothetical protein
VSDALVQQLADSIRRAEFQRVAVFPSFLRAGTTTDPLESQVVSPHGLLYAEQLQARLVARRGTDFEVVDSDTLARVARGVSAIDLADTKRLQQLAQEIGGLDAIVIGRYHTIPAAVGNQPATLQVACRLLDINTGTLHDVSRSEDRLTLADALYEGRSLEILRWQRDGKLHPVGLRQDTLSDLTPVTIATSGDPQQYDLDRPHPLSQRDFPFRVQVLVGERPRPIDFPQSRSTPYIPLEPGESFVIEVTNSLQRRVHVAVFVDGLNILGERRELPDERCQVFAIDAGKRSQYEGFYASEDGRDVLKRFRIGPVEESSAYQQGFTDQLGMISVAVFNEGQPRDHEVAPVIVPGERLAASGAVPPAVAASSRPAKPRLGERLGNALQANRARRSGEVGSAAPDVPRNAVVPDQPVPIRLVRTEGQRGPLLASFTLHYATKAEIERLQATR